MSQPQNTTTADRAQYLGAVATTAHWAFGSSSDGEKKLMAVNPHIDMGSALDVASSNLSVILEVLQETMDAEKGLSFHLAHLVGSQLEATKALVDSCSLGLLTRSRLSAGLAMEVTHG